MRFGQQDKRVRQYVVKDKEHACTVESKTVCLCSLQLASEEVFFKALGLFEASSLTSQITVPVDTEWECDTFDNKSQILFYTSASGASVVLYMKRFQIHDNPD